MNDYADLMRSAVLGIGLYSSLGVLIGVVPVAAGLSTLPLLRGAGQPAIGLLTAFALGVLGYLLFEAAAGALPSGPSASVWSVETVVFATGVAAAALVMRWLAGWLGSERGSMWLGTQAGSESTALLVAAGLGLHHLGEGLAVGTAVGAGEIRLSVLLVFGFSLHNVTEGMALAAVLIATSTNTRLVAIARICAIAGAPTILGACLGGLLAMSPLASTAAYGIAAGGIMHVIWAAYADISSVTRIRFVPAIVGLFAGSSLMFVLGAMMPEG